MTLDTTVKKILKDMYFFAKENKHPYVTPEHFLYCSLQNKHVQSLLLEFDLNHKKI